MHSLLQMAHIVKHTYLTICLKSDPNTSLSVISFYKLIFTD